MALIKGGVSGAALDVGATSKGQYVELIDSAGKLQGAESQLVDHRTREEETQYPPLRVVRDRESRR